MAVRFHRHAQQRIQERGVTEDEAAATVQYGEQFPAKFGRMGFRRNFPFGAESAWQAIWHQTSGSLCSPGGFRLAGNHCDYPLFLNTMREVERS